MDWAVVITFYIINNFFNNLLSVQYKYKTVIICICPTSLKLRTLLLTLLYNYYIETRH